MRKGRKPEPASRKPESAALLAGYRLPVTGYRFSKKN